MIGKLNESGMDDESYVEAVRIASLSVCQGGLGNEMER